MSEQKRIGKQLDQLVAERTRELAEANDALKRELVVERQRTEAVRRGGRLILASIPGLVASLTPTGGVDFVNDPLVDYCGRTLEELQQRGTAIRFTLHPQRPQHPYEELVMVQRSLVSVVDDDESVRESLPWFVRLAPC